MKIHNDRLLIKEWSICTWSVKVIVFTYALLRDRDHWKKEWFWLRKIRGGYTLGLFKARVFKNESVKFLGCRPSHTWELRDREVSTVQNQVKIPRGVWHYWAYLERFCRCVLKNLGVQTSIQRLGHFGFLLHTCSRHGTIGKGGFFKSFVSKLKWLFEDDTKHDGISAATLFSVDFMCNCLDSITGKCCTWTIDRDRWLFLVLIAVPTRRDYVLFFSVLCTHDSKLNQKVDL